MDQALLSSRAVMGMYWARLQTQPPGMEWVDLISDLILSDQDAETHAQLGMVPPMREWIGGRQARGLGEHLERIVNRHYEATLEVNARDARRDKTGQLKARIDEFADSSNLHWLSLLGALLAVSETLPGGDGVPFFSASHPLRSGVQSNSFSVSVTDAFFDLSGTPSSPSVGQVIGAVMLGATKLWQLTDEWGEPVNGEAKRFVVMVGPSQLFRFQAAVDKINEWHSDQLQVSLAVNVRLNWSSKFAVFRADGQIKPLIRQSETDLQMRTKAEGSEFAFDTDTWHFGIDAWRNVGYGRWQSACLMQLT